MNNIKLSFRDIKYGIFSFQFLEGYWIDPSGKEYKFDKGLHNTWILNNLSKLQQEYNIKKPRVEGTIEQEDIAEKIRYEMVNFLGWSSLRHYSQSWVIESQSISNVKKIPDTLKTKIIFTDIPIELGIGDTRHKIIEDQEKIIELLY